MTDKNAVELTREGMNELKEELERRKTVTAMEIAERLKDARALGDLSENSEYDDAKELQAANETRIVSIEKILKNAKLIETSSLSKTQVGLGSKVTLLDVEAKDESSYMLVSAQEEDIFKMKISSESPVGSAILGKKKGQVVHVKTPSGTIDYKIVKISQS